MEYAGESWVKGAEEHSTGQKLGYDSQTLLLLFLLDWSAVPGKNFLKALPWRLKMHLMNNFSGLVIQIAVFNGRNICNMDLLKKMCIICLCGELFTIKKKNRQKRVTQQCQEENSPVLFAGGGFCGGYGYKPWPVEEEELYTFLWQALELRRATLMESILPWPQSET